MAKLTWLGPDDYGEGETPPTSLVWAGVTFPVGVAVEVDHPVMVAKAKGNRMFKVEEAESARADRRLHPDATQWREPETEADPVDVSFFDDPPGVDEDPPIPPDYPPQDDPERNHKRKRGRPPKVRHDGDHH